MRKQPMTAWWSATNKTMKRFSFIAAALLCFVTMAGAAIRPAQPGIGGGGSTVSGSITGAYSFNGPFSVVNATNVYLSAVLSNQVMTGISAGATNASATIASSSGKGTNAQFWGTHVINGASSNLGVNPYITSQDSGGGNAGFIATGGGAQMYLSTADLGLTSTNSAGILYLWGGFGPAPTTSAEFSPTGAVMYGHVTLNSNLTFPNLSTKTRVLFADANGLVGPVAGSSAETEYVKKDGTVGTPSGGSSGTNFAGIIVTNATDLKGDVTFSGGAGTLFSAVNTSNYFGGAMQLGGMIPGVNKLFVSQDASGNGAWTNKVYIDTLTVTNSVSISGASGQTGELGIAGTNGNYVITRAALSNSVPITNVVGMLHKASASVIVLDCTHGNRFQVTNRLGQGTTFVVTNLAQGQEITIKGSADGTSRSVTVVPQLGFLVRDFDAFGVAAALNKAITATNGNTFEINIAAAWEHGTNWADVVTRQATY